MEKFISRLLSYGTLISTYALILSVLLQIFARFFLEKAPAWTEETSRLFFIYAISFAAGLAMKDNYYVQLDLIYRRMSEKGKALLDLLIPCMILFLFGLITFFSFYFITLGYAENSPSMGISMSVAFVSVLIMAGSISYYAWGQINYQLQNRKS